ncbi:MAG: FAD-dependent oxidoreductase [Marinibacterium sp.]|nr:FAD-dependent oxidoreductase [Marinibacterium sp.]
MARVDLTVRGAGIFGLSIAWEAARRGARVQVVDPNGPGAGASGGLVGALAPHVPENWNPKKAFQFDSLIMAEPFWADVGQAGGRDPGYKRSGRLQPIADAAALDLARARAASAADLWQGKASWSVVDATTFGDWAPPSPSGYLVHDTLTARLHPRHAAQALVAALASRGVPILSDAPDGTAPTIWASGVAGLEALSRDIGKPVGAGIKGQAALLRHDARDLPQLFADALHLIPHGDGTLAVGSTSERDWDDPTATDAALDDVLERAYAVLPALRDAPVIDRWAGLRPRARSRAPMLGHWPGRAGQYVANGGFKIGFGMAPKVAQVMADLVLEGRDAIPEGFRVAASIPKG